MIPFLTYRMLRKEVEKCAGKSRLGIPIEFNEFFIDHNGDI